MDDNRLFLLVGENLLQGAKSKIMNSIDKIEVVTMIVTTVFLLIVLALIGIGIGEVVSWF